MKHMHCFEVVHQTCKDILKSFDDRKKHILFGGKVLVFGGISDRYYQ